MRLVALIAAVLVVIGLGAVAMAKGGGPMQTSWKKFCYDNQKTGSKRVCWTRAEAWNMPDNSRAAVEMIEPQGEVRKILRITFPLGMQLKYGTRLIVHGVDPLRGPYTICSAAGCMADYEATPALLTSMKAGEMLVVQAIDQLGKQLSVTLSLADFWVAHDGPGTEPVIDETEAPRRPWQDDTLRPDDLGHT